MNLVINDITILTALVETFSKGDVKLMGINFCTIVSALDSSQRKVAKELELLGILTFVEIENKPKETEWIWNHYSSGVSVKELTILRYSLLHNTILLTNDPVLTYNAKELGVKVVDANFIKGEIEKNMSADEEDTQMFLVRLFRRHPEHWNWFKSQHKHLGRVASLL